MRQEKQLLLDEMRDQIDTYGSFVIMRYAGMSANSANALRIAVANTGGNIEMMRKRILIKAAKEAGVDLDLSQLEGHIGLVFAGEDPIETTKVVFKFSKDNENVLSVIGGRFDGQLYGANDVEMLAKLPGKDEMRAQLLGILEAPLSQTVSVMQSLLTSIIYCLDNKCKQEG